MQTRSALWIPAILAVSLWAAGCGDDATSSTPETLSVSISASAEAGVAPLEVDFTAVVTGEDAPVYAWDFGDGATSADAAPAHTFASAGSYTVTLVVTDADGAIAEDSVAIAVIAPLEVSVSVDPTEGLAPLLVAATSVAEGGVPPYAYAWNFGDGDGAEGPSASHVYALAGVFDVALTVTDATGATATDSASVDLGDNHTPLASITAAPTLGVAPLDVTFLGNVIGGDEPFTFAWSFGDGETDDTQNPTHTFVEPGSYTVVLVVTDADGSRSTDSLDLEVGSDDLPVVGIVANPTRGLAPLDVAFSATVAGGNAPYTYAWNFDGGAVDASVASPSHTFAAGSHSVTLTLTDADGDEASASLTLEVEADTQPTVAATASPISGQAPLAVELDCQATGGNLPLQVQWDFGDGNSSLLAVAHHTFTTPGSYTATCRVLDANGDLATDSVDVDVLGDSAPVITLQATPLVGIAALDVDFAASVGGGDAPLTYDWSFGDGGTDTVAAPSHTFATAGTYTVLVVVTDDDGDQALASVDISVTTDALPVVELAATPLAGVEPLAVSFVANVAGGNAPVAIAWDFDNDGTADSALAAASWTFAAGSHPVSVTVTDANGDTDSDTVTLDVAANTAPAVNVTATTTSGFAPLFSQLDCGATGGNAPLTYAWELGDDQTSSLAAPGHTYTQAGSYTATCTVTDADGDVAQGSILLTADDDQVPWVAPTAAPAVGPAPLTVSFAANASGGNAPLTYAWDFGDGATDTAANPTHDYATLGSYQASVTVTDADGDVVIGMVRIDVLNAPPTALAAVLEGTDCAVPQQTTVLLDGSGSSDPELAPLTYAWVFTGLPTGSSVQLNSAAIENPSFVPDLDGTYTLRLFVDDGQHRVGSAPISIVADGTANTVSILAGDGQTAEVGTDLADVEVEVANACGATIAGKRVTWTGANTTPSSPFSWTDPDGRAAVGLRAGITAGPASLTAAADGASAAFSFTLTPGPVASLLLQPVDPTVVSDTNEVALTFVTADRFGNPNPTQDVTFDLGLWGQGTLSATAGGACAAMNTAIFDVTTVGGAATVYLCSTVAQQLPVWFQVTSDPAIRAISRVQYTDDLEDGNHFTYLHGFEFGTPTSGPGAAFSGDNVIATALDGDFAAWGNYSAGYDLVAGMPFGLSHVVVEVTHWYSLDVGDGFCWDAGASVRAWGSPWQPAGGGYPYNCTPVGRGFAGVSGGWVTTTFDSAELGFAPSSIEFAMRSECWVNCPPRVDAGWYLDNLAVTATIEGGGVVSFLPGPLSQLAINVDALGSACSWGRASAWANDAFGNHVGAGVSLDLSVDAGELAGLGAAATLETDAAGRVSVDVDSLGANSATLTVTASADPTIRDNAVVIQTQPELGGLCNDGVDNDCNMATDCGDPVCSAEPQCQTVDVMSYPSAPISDYSITWDSIDVALGCGAIGDVSVPMEIYHSYRGDLIVTLYSPGGIAVRLHDRAGGGQNDILGTYPTTLVPAEPLDVLRGESVVGTWQLSVEDRAGADVGTLASWGLHITCQ